MFLPLAFYHHIHPCLNILLEMGNGYLPLNSIKEFIKLSLKNDPQPHTRLHNPKSTGDHPEEAWDEWLWKTNPEEPYAPEVLLNRCQLLGFLVCLYKGMQQAAEAAPDLTDAETCRLSHGLTLMAKPVRAMSLRELKDTIENLQVERPTCCRKGPLIIIKFPSLLLVRSRAARACLSRGQSRR
jgi:hypothetical protein